MSGLGPYGFPLFSAGHVAACNAATAAGSGKAGKDTTGKGGCFDGGKGGTPVGEDTEQQQRPQQMVLNRQFIQKLKQQQQMIDDQRQHIEALHKRDEELEKRIFAMEGQLDETSRRLAWTLSMLDRAVVLPAAAEPSVR